MNSEDQNPLNSRRGSRRRSSNHLETGKFLQDSAGGPSTTNARHSRRLLLPGIPSRYRNIFTVFLCLCVGGLVLMAVSWNSRAFFEGQSGPRVSDQGQGGLLQDELMSLKAEMKTYRKRMESDAEYIQELVQVKSELSKVKMERDSLQERLDKSNIGKDGAKKPAPEKGYIRYGKAKAFKGLSKNMFTHVNGIPRILHQSYKTANITKADWQYYAKSWTKLVPEWDYWFWLDDDNEALVRNFHRDFLEDYRTCYTPVMKADFSRLLYMYHFGGVYADFDFQLLRSLEEYPLINENNIVILGSLGYDLSCQNSIPNAIMMSTPGHPLWAYCINLAMGRCLVSIERDEIKLKSAEYYTGPNLLHTCVAEFTDPNYRRSPNQKLYSINKEEAEKKLPPKKEGETNDEYTARVAYTVRVEDRTPNFGWQEGDSRVFLARPHEFYPVSWKPMYTAVNKTLKEATAKCDVQLELLRAQNVKGKPVTGNKMLSTEMVMDFCTDIFTALGSYAVTFWTHEWSQDQAPAIKAKREKERKAREAKKKAASGQK